MLRAIMTAHISEHDLDIFTLQMNNKPIGHLTAEKSVNYVVSGNREVHVASGFYSSTDSKSERRYITEQMKRFETIFKEMQTLGLSSLPDMSVRYKPEAAFLIFAAADLVIIWQDRQKGVYLQRNKKFFRLQPVPRPHHLFEDSWMSYGDFYAFTPETDDLLLILSPEFVDHFKADQLEEIFSANQQLHAIMKELTALGGTYGYNLEQSWFALQVQRAEVNQILAGHVNEMTVGEEHRRISKDKAFSKGIKRSRASRVMYGQELIPVKHEGRRRFTAPPSHEAEALKARWQMMEAQEEEPQNSQIEVINSGKRARRQETLRAYEERRAPLDPYFEKMREFTFDPYRRRLKTYIRRFFHLWPHQPVLSVFFASSCCVLVILLLLLGFKLLANRPSNQDFTPPSEISTTTEAYQANALVNAPAETNLEIAVTVKSSNLQIRQAPDPSSALIASVKRGDTVYQLAPEQNGWVYIRTQNQVEGYVFAEYLFN